MQPVFDIAYKFISLFHGFNKILRDETQCCVNIALSLQANKQVNLLRTNNFPSIYKPI